MRKKYTNFKLKNYVKQSNNSGSPAFSVNWAKIPDRQLLDKELKGNIDMIIRDMPIKYRLPLLLHSVEGMPIKESCVILGIKAGSFKTRLHRAHLIIRGQMAEYYRDRYKSENKKEPGCGIWTKFMYDYINREFEDTEKNAFDNHLKYCAECKKFIKTYSDAIRITNALECMDIPFELKKKIETFLAYKHLNI